MFRNDIFNIYMYLEDLTLNKLQWFIRHKNKPSQTKPSQTNYIRGAFNKFPDFFVQAFKSVVDSWKFSMLLLYILWDDWSIFMISGSNE